MFEAFYSRINVTETKESTQILFVLSDDIYYIFYNEFFTWRCFHEFLAGCLQGAKEPVDTLHLNPSMVDVNSEIGAHVYYMFFLTVQGIW